MLLVILFFLSGIGIALLLVSKRMEEKYRRSLFLLGAISKGDTKVREWSHKATHWYSEARVRTEFFVKKQLPLHTKNLWNKSTSYLITQAEKHVGNIRGSRFLRRSGGISEYFKNISEVEKGNGEIQDDVFSESSQEDADQVK